VSALRGLALLALALLASSIGVRSRDLTPKQHGVSWVGGRDEVTAADFDRLVENGVDWIAQNPFGWQRGLDTPEIRFAGDRGWWGERDEGIRRTTELARARGIHTLLRPHLWLSGAPAGMWLGDLTMKTEEDWQRWFASYEAFLLHYARLAEELGIEALSVGAELRLVSTTRENDWRRLIAHVRPVYHGRLTYAANWHAEFEQITFWDALDFIGIQAYFPLSEEREPSVAALEAAWKPHLAAIERVARRTGKSVVFTEIGYRSVPGATTRPWEWPEHGVDDPPTEAGLHLQADAYEAFFRTFWRCDWFAGAYVWKWYPGLERSARPPTAEFSPQNKPAERVLARWYRAARP
jgi:hypothetical protein